MIDTKNYILLENEGYVNRAEAYNHIRLWYTHMNGVTTYYDDGKWYIKLLCNSSKYRKWRGHAIASPLYSGKKKL